MCCIYASVNRVSSGFDNGLSPIKRQAIIKTNAGLLLIWKYRLRNGGHFVQGKLS